MPQGRAGGMADLRDAVARIEKFRAPALATRGRAPLSVAPAIDAALGGLAADSLHEIIPASAADGAAAMGFALALAARFCAGSERASALLAGEDFHAIEAGALYGPGLAAFGLDPARIVIVRAPDARALLWTLEEALKSGAPAVVVGEIGRAARHYDLKASRRLLLAARAGFAPALIVHAFGGAHSSAAETRFEIAAAPTVRPEGPASAGGHPLPGAPAFAARILKARGPRALDDSRIFRLHWRADERRFDDEVSEPVAAAPAGGSRARAWPQ